MDDPLGSARTKLARANLHTRFAKRAARTFIDKHAAPPLTVKQITELERVEVGSVIDAQLVFGEGPAMPDLPPSFSARFGDAIQNYRSALDHLAWQLVKHGSTPNPPKDYLVQFPIYFSEKRFSEELATCLPGVDARGGGPCEFIKHRHRYKRQKARNEVLVRLKKISNDDKHRALHTMVAALGQAKHNVTFDNCVPTAWTNPPEPPRASSQVQ